MSKATLELARSILQKNKNDHFNFEEKVSYIVSTGSLSMDIELLGGITPGIVRICGATEAGKTALTLEIARNFQLLGMNDFTVYFNAESRLNDYVKRRSGVDFSEDRWLTVDTNVWDLCIQMMRDLVKDNPDKKRFLFIFDSVDNLISKADYDKDEGEALKMASSAMILTTLFKRMSAALTKMGHIAIFISQVRANVEDKYTSKEGRKQDSTSSSAANALVHNSNYTIEMHKRNNGDLILKNPSKAMDPVENRPIGHWVQTVLKKTPNEKSNIRVQYPIKYYQVDGKSVWKEFELVAKLREWNLVDGKTWFNFTDSIVNEINNHLDGLLAKEKNEARKSEIEAEKKKLSDSNKFQGENNLRIFIEESPIICEFLIKFVKKISM